MIKKWKRNFIFSSLFLVLLLAGCTKTSQTTQEPVAEPTVAATPVPATEEPSLPQEDEASEEAFSEEDLYHDYKETGGEVALITDFSNVLDKGFNEAAYEGAKIYAQAAGVSYSYYSATEDTEEEYIKIMENAIQTGSRLLICAGYNLEQAVGELQSVYPDVDFLLLDGVPIDASGKEIPLTPNVHCITYREEEAGYLAGYIAVLDGYTKFGFIGGQEVPTVIRYGHGYLQGINDAALVTGNESQIDVNYWYSDTFNPDKEISQMAQEWYEDGTEIIFSCGGAIYESILEAADLCDGKMIGVDVNQSALSPRIITSAMKGITNSVIITLDDYIANGSCWDDTAAGQIACYGAEEKCIELPTDDDSWRFQNVQTDTYDSLFIQLKKGEIVVEDDIQTTPSVSINVTYINP